MSPYDAHARSESIHVLVVGSEAFASALPRAALRELRCDLRCVPDLDAALGALTPGAYDIVISQVSGPGIDGLALCRAVRGDPLVSFTSLFLVGTESSADSSERLRALRAGADRFVTDSEPAEVLLAMAGSVRRGILERRAAQRMAAQQQAVRTVVTAVARGIEASELFDLCAREVAGLLGADAGAVWRFEDGGARPMGWWSPSGRRPVMTLPLKGVGVLSQVQTTLSPARVDDYEALDTDTLAPVVIDSPYRSSIAAPVLWGGQAWGAVLATAKSHTTFPSGSEQELRSFSEALALAIVGDESRAERDALLAELREVQRLQAVGQLAAGVAHEINTPIQFVGNSVDFLEEAFGDLRELVGRYRAALANPTEAARAEMAAAETALDIEYVLEKVPEALSWSQEGIARVADIVQAMKGYAHTAGGHKAPADLNRAIRMGLTIATNHIKHAADVHCDLAEIPPVHCCIAEINQVILNLILNAADAIVDTGSGRGTIRIRTEVDGDTVLLSVADSGCGIPESARARVFEPFFTTKEVGRGSGQGLALAWSIVVEGHAGSLDFDTELGEGTTFRMRLPILPLGSTSDGSV